MLQRVVKAYSKICKVALIVAGVSLFVMMAYTFFGVAGRFLFNRPLPGALELTEMLMVFVVFMAMAACQLQKRHMRVDFLFPKFSRKGLAVLDIVAYALDIVFCGLLARFALPYAWTSWNNKEVAWGQLPYPVFLPKFVVVLGLVMLLVQFLLDLLGAIRNYRQAAPVSLSHAGGEE